MTRPIDADELRELYNEHNFDTYNDYNFAIDTLDNMPTIDAEPVIRCKDCKYYTGKWCKRDSIHAADSNDRMVLENDYCSRAERRIDLDFIEE